jgi:hypothetical protein
MSAVTDQLVAFGKRPKLTHIFEKEEHLHYIEPEWVSIRLFKIEQFPGPVWDPFAGWGRVVDAARAAGYATQATDIVDRGYPLDAVEDFLNIKHIASDVSIVANPPFTDEIAQHAIKLNPIKLALIWPLARVVAAWPWLAEAPLARVLLLTPRPAMPPGSYIARGERPGGARVEHCWLIFERNYAGPPQLGWLRRDGDSRPSMSQRKSAACAPLIGEHPAP